MVSQPKPRRRAIAVGLCLWGAWGLRPAATVRGSDPYPELFDYRQLVSQYRSGEIDPAVESVSAWSNRRLLKATGTLWHLKESDRVMRGWDVTNVAAAALLHLEVLMRHGGEARRDSLHLHVLREHLLRLRRLQPLPPYARDLHLALVMHLQGQLRLEDLGRLFEELGDTFASDGSFLLAEGTLHEVLASRRLEAARDALLVPGAQASLENAERVLRRADAVTPVPGEARLRLAHVLIQRGKPAEGLAALQPLLGHPDAVTRYLAYLFAGLAHASAGRPDLAEGAFMRSAAQLECGQAAAMARAHQAFRGGRPDVARETLEAALLPANSCTDPWAAYDFGQRGQLAGTIGTLRSGLRD